MLLAAARRFLVLLGAVGAVAVVSLGVGAASALAEPRARGRVLGLRLPAARAGFFVGNRGPARPKGEAAPLFGPRFLRWATPEEHARIAQSAIFIVLGLSWS